MSDEWATAALRSFAFSRRGARRRCVRSTLMRQSTAARTSSELEAVSSTSAFGQSVRVAAGAVGAPAKPNATRRAPHAKALKRVEWDVLIEPSSDQLGGGKRAQDAGGGPTEPRPTYGAPLLASTLY